MTAPDGRDLNRINPSPTVHNRPPEKPSVRKLTSRQVGVIGTVIVDLILAQVALALGGIDILGFKPFAFLTAWGQQIQVNAAAAYAKAMAAEAVANSADANQAIALGQVVTTKNDTAKTKIGLQTTWNNLWEANTDQTASADKTAADVKTTQATVRTNAIQGASGAVVNGENIQGTWDNIWNGTYNTNVSGKDLTAVKTATGAIVYSTNIAGSASQTNAGNIQNTWDKIYVAAGGTGSGSNRSLADAQDRLSLLNTTAYRADGNVYNTWDEFFTAVYGWKPQNPSATDFGKAATDLGTSVADIPTRFEPLIPEAGGGTYGGNNVSDTFTDYVTSLPNPPWTVNYVYPSGGYGSGTLGINTNKVVVWSDSGLSFRRGVAIYNKTQLATKYHKVAVGLAGWPAVGASNWIYARSNSTGSTAVAAKIYVNTFLVFFNVSFTVELYSITTAGSVTTYTPITSTTTALPNTNSTWTFEAGTSAGLNTYRVLCDGKQVLAHTASGLADGGNYVGFGMEANSFIGPLRPAPVNSFSAYDSKAADYLGCGYRASRATTTGNAVGGTTGAVLSSAVFNSEDIPASNTLTKIDNSQIQVRVAGWYAVTVSLAISEAVAAIRPAVIVNSNVVAKGQWANPSCMTFVVYAAANDTIKAGYEAGGSFVTIVGEGSGTTTYWSLAFIGNRLPSNPSDSKL